MDSKKAYLLSHFTKESLANGEQVYFSVSEDGLNWHDLNNSKAVLISDIGEKGVRDPFITKSKIDGKFYILATDLCIAKGTSWAQAVDKGSKSMIIWSSEDLINWEGPWTYDVPLDNIGCVWAPEAIYDAKRDNYLVFWASMTKKNGKSKHIIYKSRTRDFKTFTSPEIYIEKDTHIIDTTIVEDNGLYYRISKDESETKSIKIDYGDDLDGKFTAVKSSDLDAIYGVEGPTCYLLPDGKTWCLLADHFLAHTGYAPIVSTDLKSGVFKELEKDCYDMGKSIKRHGSVLEITQDDYNRLVEHFGL
ncbi:MAG: glycoside hydrolase family 43 protein [Treponema sp.]|nr:glycoside hydrolase family 43 protein [Treponema sp.]